MKAKLLKIGAYTYAIGGAATWCAVFFANRRRNKPNGQLAAEAGLVSVLWPAVWLTAFVEEFLPMLGEVR